MIKIKSLYFNAEQWILEINGQPINQPVMLEWPEGLSEEALPRKMIITDLSKEESVKRSIQGDKLPILTITFTNGTGSYSINDTASDSACHQE